MKLTQNYKFNKPEENDAADISKLNDNMDILDTKLKEIEFKASTAAPVRSVNGKTGDVVINAGDVRLQSGTPLQKKVEDTDYQILPKNAMSIYSETNKGLSLNDIVNGISHVKSVEGNSLVNINKPYWNFTASPAGIMTKTNIDRGVRITRSKNDPLTWATVLMGNFIGPLKEDTTYSFIFEAKTPARFNAAAVLQSEDGKNQLSDVVSFTLTNMINVITIKTFKFDSVKPSNQVLGLGVAAIPVGNLDITNLMVLEGDWSNKPIPPYFEDIKSINEIKVNSIYKNWANFTTPVNFKAGVEAGTELFPLTFSEPIFSMAMYNDGSLIPTNGNIILSFYDENKNHIDGWGLWANPRSNMDTTNLRYWNRVRYGKIAATKDLNVDVTITHLMVNGGEKNLSYEPYKESVSGIKLLEGQELKGIPLGSKDSIESSLITYNTKQITFTGDEDWKPDRINDMGILNMFLDIVDQPPANSDTEVTPWRILCNNFPQTKDYISAAKQRGILVGSNSDLNCARIFLRIETSCLTGVDKNDSDTWKPALKKWFSENTTQYIYPLKQPYTKPCSLSPVQCFKGGTIITNISIPTNYTLLYPTQLSSRVDNVENSVTNLGQGLQQCFTLASEGKNSIVTALHEKGQTAAATTDTFPALADFIRAIQSGKKWAVGSGNVKVTEKGGAKVVAINVYPKVDFDPKVIHIMVTSVVKTKPYQDMRSLRLDYPTISYHMIAPHPVVPVVSASVVSNDGVEEKYIRGQVVSQVKPTKDFFGGFFETDGLFPEGDIYYYTWFIAE